ncbi:MAG: hypothetical protein ACRDHE_09840 [Ktedonobacterales bacterium]
MNVEAIRNTAAHRVAAHRTLLNRTLLKGTLLACALTLALAACGPFGGDGKQPTVSTDASLAQLSWCDQPLIEFQDNSSTSQTVITAWDQVKSQLGFTTYLPTTLPKGSCLVLAGGVIHDPIYGGHLSITYDLPGDQGPISFSEAPKRPNLDTSLQCSQNTPATTTTTATATTTPATTTPTTTICLGVIANTSVTIASRETQSQVQALFNSLKANVDWVPANTNQLLATPTPTTGTATAAATATTGG